MITRYLAIGMAGLTGILLITALWYKGKAEALAVDNAHYKDAVSLQRDTIEHFKRMQDRQGVIATKYQSGLNEANKAAREAQNEIAQLRAIESRKALQRPFDAAVGHDTRIRRTLSRLRGEGPLARRARGGDSEASDSTSADQAE